MLFRIKDEKAKKLEAQLDKLQKDGPAAWAKLPEDELFTPAGFSEEQAEATGYSNYSYWGSTFRAFFKNKLAVALLAVKKGAAGELPVGKITQTLLRRKRKDAAGQGNAAVS